MLFDSTSVWVVVVNEGGSDGDGDKDNDNDNDDDDECIINGGDLGMVGVDVGVSNGWVKSNRVW